MTGVFLDICREKTHRKGDVKTGAEPVFYKVRKVRVVSSHQKRGEKGMECIFPQSFQKEPAWLTP